MTASRLGDQGKTSLNLSLANIPQGPASDHPDWLSRLLNFSQPATFDIVHSTDRFNEGSFNRWNLLVLPRDADRVEERGEIMPPPAVQPRDERACLIVDDAHMPAVHMVDAV